MNIKDAKTLYAFLDAADNARGNVFLVSQNGDRYNLKSELTKYVAIGALLGNHGDELELFCEEKDDEGLFLAFFHKFADSL